MSFKFLTFLGISFLTATVLTGCGIGPVDHSSSGAFVISGVVHGGQQPVSGATIQLYTVGSSGIASAATPMLTRGVASDGQGNFNISGSYTCGQSSTRATIAGSDQVYIVASGGNPGLDPAVNNKALVMVAALGSCANLSSLSYIEINELTTVAAAWALAPFTASSTQIGATSTNPDGIRNAFLDAALLVDITSGQPTTLPTTMSIEKDKLIALADAIASCVNSNGGSGCTPLFTAATPSGGTAPADTLAAALNIVKHPGQNVALVYKAIGSFPPFVTGLKTAPNDWTMSLTLSNAGLVPPATYGGLNSPTSLAIDKDSNVWVVGQDGPLSAFGPQGAPLSATGYGAGSIAQVYAVALDSVGDVWVTNHNGGSGKGSATEFAGSDAMAPTLPGTILGDHSNGILYPDALSADTNGNIFIAQEDSSSASVYSSAGVLLYNSLGSAANLNAHPQGLAVDANHGFWMPDGSTSVAHISAPSTAYPYGQLLSNVVCCNESYGVATDKDGTLWVADHLGGSDFEGSFSEVVTNAQGNASAVISDAQVGGIDHAAFVAVDGAQNVWFSNQGGGTITEIAGSHTTVPAGTALSPSAGPDGPGGYGLDINLVVALGIAPDRAGNIWVTSEGNNSVVMFFGLAAPTATPVQPIPLAP